MKKKWKRTCSMVMAMIMTVLMIPLTAKTAFEIGTADSGAVTDFGEMVDRSDITNTGRSSDELNKIYVAPDGNDAGTGTHDDPLKTLDGARLAVRKLLANKENIAGDIVVEFADGFYELENTVEFTPEDSGDEDCVVYYQAAPNARPVISGGKKLDGPWEEATEVNWLADGLKAYKTTLNRNSKLRAIYVNGERANRTEKTGVTPINNTDNIPRYSYNINGTITIDGVEQELQPGEDRSWIWGTSNNVIGGAKFRVADLPPNTRNAQNIELSAKGGAKWVWPLACVARIEEDPADPTHTIAHLQMPFNALAQSMSWGTNYSRTNTHVIYNVFEHLGKAGDFYFDEGADTLYYIPRAGDEDMTDAEVIIPELVNLVDIRGEYTFDKDNDIGGDRVKTDTSYVEHITFKGLTFSYGDWNLYELAGSYGYSTVQTCVMFIAMADGNWHNDMYRSYDVVPSMVTINTARNIRVLDGGIALSGANGLHLENDVSDCEVTGNYVNRVGHAGVVVGHPQHLYVDDHIEKHVVSGTGRATYDKEKFRYGTEAIPKNIFITNNYFYRTGYMYHNNNNIYAFFTENLQILHNFIYDMPSAGIAVGWGWWNFDGSSGSQLPGKPTTTARNNRISYNRVESFSRLLDDSGGIYTLGRQGNNFEDGTHTEMNNNYINGYRLEQGQTPPNGWVNGFHPDEGSRFIKFDNNVTQRIIRSFYEVQTFGGKGDMIITNAYVDRHIAENQGLFPNSVGTSLASDVVAERPYANTECIWPQPGHDIVRNSGLEDQYTYMVPESILKKTDYELASNVKIEVGGTLNRRGLLKADDEVWIAPVGTTVFKEGPTMTKAAGNAKTIDVPEKMDVYKLFIKYSDGTPTEVSQYTIYTDTPDFVANVEEGERYSVAKLAPKELLLSDDNYTFRLNDVTVTTGHKIITENTWVLVATPKVEGKEPVTVSFTTYISEANKLLPDNVTVKAGAKVELSYDLNDPDKYIWIAPNGLSGLALDNPRVTRTEGDELSIVAPEVPGDDYAVFVTDKTGQILSLSAARVKVNPAVEITSFIATRTSNSEFSVSANLISEAATTVTVYIALYDTDGRMLKVTSTPMTLSAAMATSVEEDISHNLISGQKYKVKMFVWGDEMIPLSKAGERTLS